MKAKREIKLKYVSNKEILYYLYFLFNPPLNFESWYLFNNYGLDYRFFKYLMLKYKLCTHPDLYPIALTHNFIVNPFLLWDFSSNHNKIWISMVVVPLAVLTMIGFTYQDELEFWPKSNHPKWKLLQLQQVAPLVYSGIGIPGTYPT